MSNAVTEMKLGTKFWTSHSSVFLGPNGKCMEVPAGYMVEVYFTNKRSHDSKYCYVLFVDEVGERWFNNAYRWR